jgi:GT2 family glycosyltransferase
LIVDNASVDGSPEELNRRYPNARIIRNGTNLGFATANNIGIRESKGEYIVLINPDVILTNDWLERLSDCVEKDRVIGIASPKLLRYDGRIDSTGHVFSFSRLEVKNRGEEEQDYGQYDEYTDLLSCDFACCLIRRETLTQIGPLDERIFLDHEDIDYCLRTRIAGWRIVYCPSSIVYHHRGGVTPGARKRGRQLQARRYLLRIALKGYGRRNIVRVIIYKQRDLLSFSLDLAVALKKHDVAAVKKSLDEIGALFIAFFWNAIHLPIRERILVQRSRRVDDKELELISRSSVPGASDSYR